MAVESATHISELDLTTIGVGTEPVEGGEQVNLVKTVLKTDFANINAAVTATAAELNYLDIATLGTAAASKALVADASANINAAAITWTNAGTMTTVDINGGTIEGTVGGTTPASGTFTTLTANTSFVLNGSTALTSVDTDLSTTSASHDTMTTALAVKTYADSVVTGYALESYVDARAFVVLTHVIDDISTATTVYVPVSVAGTVTRVDTVLGGTISGADAAIALTTSTDQGMANITVANAGSGAGDLDSDTSINNATVTAGSYLKLSTDGASTGTVPLTVAITVDIS